MRPGDQPKGIYYNHIRHIYTMIFAIKSQSRVELIVTCSLGLSRDRVLLSIKPLGKSFQSRIVLGKKLYL